MKCCHTRVVKDLFSGQINTYGRIYSIFDVGFQTRFPSRSPFCRDLSRCTLQCGISCLGYPNMRNSFASQQAEQKVIPHISCIGFKGEKRKKRKSKAQNKPSENSKADADSQDFKICLRNQRAGFRSS